MEQLPDSDTSSAAHVGFLGLGSNLGDPRAQLQAAVDALPGLGVAVLASSSTYQTAPVGEVLDQPAFLNACLKIVTELEPLQLLAACKSIEQQQGRILADQPGYVRHGPRAIDIDILLLGQQTVELETLTVPHQELTNRRFVLIPLLALNPDLTLPNGNRLADALQQLPDQQTVALAGPALDVSASSPTREHSSFRVDFNSLSGSGRLRMRFSGAPDVKMGELLQVHDEDGNTMRARVVGINAVQGLVWLQPLFNSWVPAPGQV